jgi:hypothetical protein
MATLDWDAINSNLNAQILGANVNLLQKKYTARDGSSVEYRDFQDIAKLTTIAENNAALDAIKTYGIGQRVEIEFD